MNKVKNIFFILLVILFSFTSESLAATYYISYSTGNDEQDGLTPDTAWKYCPKMRLSSDNTALNPGHSLASGDIVYFKRGDTWDEVYLLVRPDIGGIKLSSISSFAVSGQESTLPKIRPWMAHPTGWHLESGTIYSKSVGTIYSEKNYVKAFGVWHNGVPLTWVDSNSPGVGQWHWDNSTSDRKMYVNIGKSPNNEDIRINPSGAAVELWGDNYTVEYLDLSRAAYAALSIFKTGSGNKADSCTVQYNKLHDIQTDYTFRMCSGDSGTACISNDDCTGIGTCTTLKHTSLGQGISGEALSNFQFVGNEVYNISVTEKHLTHKSHGVYIGDYLDTATVAYNYIHNCDAGSGIVTGIEPDDLPNSVCRNVKIYGNVIDSCDTGIYYTDCTDCIVANNTITNSYWRGIAEWNTPKSRIVNNLFSNPLATNPAARYIYDITWETANNQAIPDYNYYYRTNNTEYILRVEGTPVNYFGIIDWARYKTAHPVWDAHSIASVGSPFAVPTNLINSQAKGKGQDLSSVLGTDMMLDPKTTWPLGVRLGKQSSSAWDMGAYLSSSLSLMSSPKNFRAKQ
jgi:parallel beta-helix repeat protein